MQWSHPIIILSIKIAYFVFEEFDKFQRRKSHQKMLDSPFSKTVSAISSFVYHLPINITAKFHEIAH